MKTCCVQNEAVVPLQTKQFHLPFKHLALQAGLESKSFSESRGAGKGSRGVSVLQPLLLGDAGDAPPAGAAVGTVLSAPGPCCV